MLTPMTARILKLVAVLQLLGLAMLLLAQVAAARQGYPFSDSHWIGVALVALATLLCSAGLVRGLERAITAAIVLQALQVVGVATSAVTFQLVMGPVARLVLVNQSMTAQFGAYGGFSFGFDRVSDPPLMVNFVPLAIGAVLLRARVRRSTTATLPGGAA